MYGVGARACVYKNNIYGICNISIVLYKRGATVGAAAINRWHHCKRSVWYTHGACAREVLMFGQYSVGGVGATRPMRTHCCAMTNGLPDRLVNFDFSPVFR